MAKRIDRASRRIKAAPSEVYRAFESAEAMVAWLPPEGMTGKMLAFDFREGGRYRIQLFYPGTEPVPGKTGKGFDEVEVDFVKLVKGRHIGQSVRFESDSADFSGEMSIKWDFEKSESGTAVSVRCENVPAGISPEDHKEGLRSSLKNLARYVEGKAPGRPRRKGRAKPRKGA